VLVVSRPHPADVGADVVAEGGGSIRYSEANAVPNVGVGARVSWSPSVLRREIEGGDIGYGRTGS
jgi:hypothetical protein